MLYQLAAQWIPTVNEKLIGLHHQHEMVCKEIEVHLRREKECLIVCLIGAKIELRKLRLSSARKQLFHCLSLCLAIDWRPI